MFPAPKKRDKPYIWVTWLSGLLVGTKQCKWSTWHRAHFHFNKTPEKDWTESNIKHTEIRNNLLKDLEQQVDCKIYLEREVQMDRPTVCLNGKIDAVAVGNDRAMAFEVKSGKPRQSDRAQLMIYMWMLKRGYKRYNDVLLDGMLVYENERMRIDSLEINEDFDRCFKGLVKSLIHEEPPRKYPKHDECRFCNIADCDERLVEAEMDELADMLFPNF